MLRVYTRHYPPCPHADGNHRRCHCPKWINGTLPTGQFVRVSAKTRSWENAERKARILEVNADPLRPARPDVSSRITVEEAVRDFLSDEEARQLAKTTTFGSASGNNRASNNRDEEPATEVPSRRLGAPPAFADDCGRMTSNPEIESRRAR